MSIQPEHKESETREPEDATSVEMVASLYRLLEEKSFTTTTNCKNLRTDPRREDRTNLEEEGPEKHEAFVGVWQTIQQGESVLLS